VTPYSTLDVGWKSSPVRPTAWDPPTRCGPTSVAAAVLGFTVYSEPAAPFEPVAAYTVGPVESSARASVLAGRLPIVVTAPVLVSMEIRLVSVAADRREMPAAAQPPPPRTVAYRMYHADPA
jgi:hypothetical protein